MKRLFESQGWVDLQVNGFAGWDFNAADVSSETVAKIARALVQEGVTKFFPTLITQSEGNLVQGLRAIAHGCVQDALAASMVQGIHLEGPYLSPQDGARGAHALEHLRPPDWEEFLRFQEAAEGRIRLVTLAPELPGAIGWIEKATRSGVKVSLGHTLADRIQIQAAIDAGATLSTHLG
jgi:N-acetylglucosamine-6-phosphate deacetylase